MSKNDVYIPKTVRPPRTVVSLIRQRNIMLGLPIKRLGIATIPWGYEIDPDNKELLRPVERELRLLYKARKLTARSSLKGLAEWLTKETGRKLTYQSLQYIFANRPPLNAYELTLDQRLRIATDPTEESAYSLCSFQRKDITGTDESYRKSREEAVRRAEEAREYTPRTK